MKRYLLFLGFVLIVFQLNAQYKIRGNVVSANAQMTYLDSVSLTLRQGNTIIATTTTNALGYFVFGNVANGTYTLQANCSKKWGGCNSTDAMAIVQHFVNINTLSGIRKKAADVDASAFITTLDALMVTKRFTYVVNTFPSGDWVTEEKTITVSGNHVFVIVKAACAGDVNASYIPPAAFSCGQNLVDTRDNQSYPTVLIGNRCWMAKNLNVGTFIYGVGPQTNNYIIEKYCYQNLTSNCTTYGGLYQWDEMMNYTGEEGATGICPAGWHVPADSEWDTLVAALGGASLAGGAMKQGGSSGFNALMAGWVYGCQKFRQLGVQTFLWSSDPFYGLYAWTRVLTYNNTIALRDYKEQDNGQSLRCIKD